MKRLLKDRRGSVPILMFMWIFVLLLVTFLVIEMESAFESYDHAVDSLQRTCNIAVEGNVMDEYRQDGVLKLDTDGAEADFYAYLQTDLADKYGVTVQSITCTESPPSLTATGTVTFNTIFAQYGWDDLTFEYKVRSTNYDLN